MAIRERPVKPVSGGSGSAGQAAVATLPRAASGRGGIAALLEDERVLGVMLLLPTIVLLTLFIAYPFVKGVWLSLTSATVGNPGLFVAFDNFVKIWNDTIFQRAAYNTFVYTGVATVLKLALGMWLALLLNRHFRGKRLVRASMLLPFIIPTVLSTFAWTRAAVSAPASEARISATSPGTSCSITKIVMVTPNRVGTNRRRRRAT